MEAHLLELVILHLENLSVRLARFGALASAGALLANPKSSESTRRAVVDSLSRRVFRGNADCALLRCAIKLLGGLLALHRASAPSILQLLVPLLIGNKTLAVDALAFISSMDGFLLDYNLLLLFASSPVVSLRSMVVRFLVSSLDGDKPINVVMDPHSMIPVLLGLADDICPSIRANAVDGLASLCRQTRFGVSLQIVKCLYDCAASLLPNENELVRLSAIRLISSCGEVLERNKVDTCYRELMDAVFLQLCVMARDMDMKVRVEAFSSLQKVQGVSETTLLQSLSKKILGTRRIQNPLIEHNLRNSKFPFSSSGVFVHGIEDEFHEVRLVACKSLGTLTSLSVQFSAAAMDLLMDLLNDDAIAIRLQCLEALYQLATNDQLVIQEKHMDMLLGLLNDVSAITRYATRKFLCFLKIPKHGLFKATIDSFLLNLEAHPEEEEDVLITLFCIGIRNAKFASKLAKEFALVPFGAGELSLDSPRVAGQLVLVIASIFSNKQKFTDIPPALCSFMLLLVGRISRCMGGFLKQNLLSDYLCNLSGISASFGLPIHQETELTAVKLEDALANSLKCRYHLRSSFLLLHDEKLKIEFKEYRMNLCHGSTSSELLFHPEEQVDMLTQSIKFILRKVQETWPLIHSNCFLVARRNLRNCIEELNIISSDIIGSGADFAAFALEYVLVIKLVAEIWQHLHAKSFQTTGMASLDILIEKLEKSLRQINYCFWGLSVEEESHILELILLAHVIQLHKAGMCSDDMLKKMHAAKSRLQLLHDERSNISDFIDELNKYSNGGLNESSLELPVDKLLKLFYLRPTLFHGKIQRIKSDLKALYNNSKNPLPFIPGLPVGITFQFILYNIPQENQVWVSMTVGSSVQYIFVDLCDVVYCNDVRNCTLTLPFYATHMAVSFVLKACVRLELAVGGDAVHLKRADKGGPKHDSMRISEEVDVYFGGIQSY